MGAHLLSLIVFFYSDLCAYVVCVCVLYGMCVQCVCFVQCLWGVCVVYVVFGVCGDWGWGCILCDVCGVCDVCMGICLWYEICVVCGGVYYSTDGMYVYGVGVEGSICGVCEMCVWYGICGVRTCMLWHA